MRFQGIEQLPAGIITRPGGLCARSARGGGAAHESRMQQFPKTKKEGKNINIYIDILIYKRKRRSVFARSLGVAAAGATHTQGAAQHWTLTKTESIYTTLDGRRIR